jgi:ppGpp synthetase/RelA/SpoT-type nucleotidyltranferase
LKNFLKNKEDNEFLFISKHFKKPISRQHAWDYAKDVGRLAGLNIFQVTETKEREGVDLLLFKKSYKQFMSDNKAPKGLIDLKLRSQTNNRYGNYKLYDLKLFERRIFKTTFSDDEIQEYTSWYKTNQEIYEKLAKEVRRILDGVLKQRGIKVQDIEAREKDTEKFQQKLRNGVTYSDPKKMQDLAGIRIICFVKSDVKKVCDAIEKNFEVISMKGNEEKRNDISGYSDIQYVCKLTKARIASSEELKPYENKSFEIQVRTILQHAWSEIEHDDIYKNTANISNDLRRRFFLVSNVLESADNELDNLHHKIKDGN